MDPVEDECARILSQDNRRSPNQSQNLSRFQPLIREGKIQEVIWKLRKQGFLDQANEIESVFLEELRFAPIQSIQPMGVQSLNRVFLVTFKNQHQAIFKPESNRPPFYKPRLDVAAFALDRSLGLGLVPATTLREIDGYGVGMMQAYLEGVKNIQPEKQAYDPVLNVFDFMISQGDRRKNHFALPGGRQVAIDNDWGWNKDYLPLFEFERAGVLGDPSAFFPGVQIWDQLISLSDQGLRQAVAPWLNSAEINFVISRKRALVQWVNQYLQGQINRQNQQVQNLNSRLKTVLSENGFEVATFFSPFREGNPDPYQPKTLGGSGDWLILHEVSNSNTLDPEKQKLVLSLGDVSGHGITAMDLAIRITDRLTLDALKWEDSMETILKRWSSSILGEFKTDSAAFTTFAQVHLYPQSGQIEFAHASTPPLFIKRKNGDLQILESANPPVSPDLPVTQFSQTVIEKLEPGDQLILLTDGLLEAGIRRESSSREVWTELGARGSLFNRMLKRFKDPTPQQLVEVIQQMARRPHDDISLIVIKYQGPIR